MLTLTPFQTVGPFLSLGLRLGVGRQSVSDAGPRIVIKGQLRDGRGHGIPDGVLEWWHPSFASVQRTLTEGDGSFVVETVKPPNVPGPDGREQAPHLALRVLGRGIQTQYITRMYFDDQPGGVTDPILNLVPDERRHTLIASRLAADHYQFDIVVQGDNETVFFDL